MSSIPSGSGDTVAAAWPQTVSERPPQAPQQVLAPVATLLGTSPAAVLAELRSGATLQSLASARGVSQSSLLEAIEQGLQGGGAQPAPPRPPAPGSAGGSSAPVGTGPPSAALATGAGGYSPVGALGVGGKAAHPMAGLATILGYEPSALEQALAGGAKLSELASARGISASGLQSFLETGMQIDTTA